MFPRNTTDLSETVSCEARVANESCGDRLLLRVAIKDNKIAAVQIAPSGCAVSTAAASIVSDYLLGKSLDDVERVLRNYSDGLLASNIPEELAELKHLESLGKFPARHRCATLIVEAFQDVLKLPSQVTEIN